MRRAAFAVYCAAAAALFIPWATEEREVVESTPAHTPLYQRVEVPVAPGKEVCVEPVTIPRRADRLRFGVLTGARPGPELAVTATAPGYRAEARIPAGYVDALTLDADIAPPKRDVRGAVCFRNAGERSAGLVGTTDARILARADPTVDGQRLPTTEVSLQVMRRERASLASRTGELFDHAANVAPGFAGRWLFALLALVVVLGVPLGALAAAAQPEDREQERREEDLQADDQ